MQRFEVHSHTEYSNIRLLDCINKPEDLINYAIKQGLAGIAITDHECLSAAIKINKIAKSIKEEHPDFKIAMGNEIYLVDERKPSQQYYHFILIAKDVEGFRQLRQLSSQSWMQSYIDRRMERVPTTKLELGKIVSQNPGHLIATSACLGGELSSSILAMEKARHIGDTQTAAEKYEDITEFIEDCQQLFGNDFYIECAPGCSKEQRLVNEKLAQIADVYRIPMVIGTDAHYLKAEDAFIHEAYLNSKEGEREVLSFYQFAYLQTEDEIINNLHQEKEGVFDTKRIEHMFATSMEIYYKIEQYDLFHTQDIPKVEVKNYEKALTPSRYFEGYNKEYPILTNMLMSNDKYERYWVNECLQKLLEIHKYNEVYLDRLEYEADIKRTVGEKLKTNMFRYPITLQHYIDLFWECGSLVGAGRGSSCSGLNHYLLGVTQLDPIKWDLPFWRLEL